LHGFRRIGCNTSIALEIIDTTRLTSLVCGITYDDAEGGDFEIVGLTRDAELCEHSRTKGIEVDLHRIARIS